VVLRGLTTTRQLVPQQPVGVEEERGSSLGWETTVGLGRSFPSSIGWERGNAGNTPKLEMAGKERHHIKKIP